MSHPERIVPDDTEPGIVALHLKRYEFARPLCVDRHVLDAGCGVGYGTAYLAEVARSVVGLDLSAGAIDYARERYRTANVEFSVGDVLSIPRADGEFDVVCAFETIEHVADPERLVAEARRVLKRDGTLCVSTPRADVTDERPANPFHEREFSPDDFERLLRTRFGSVQLFGQRRLQTARHRALQRLDVLGVRRRVAFVRRLGRAVTGTPAMAELSSADVEIGTSLDGASELLAICSA